MDRKIGFLLLTIFFALFSLPFTVRASEEFVILPQIETVEVPQVVFEVDAAPVAILVGQTFPLDQVESDPSLAPSQEAKPSEETKPQVVVAADAVSTYSSDKTGSFTATGYSCSLQEETAHWENGSLVCNRTSSGTLPEWGVIAVDPSIIAPGTKVKIDYFPDQIFTASDTGGAIVGNRIDIWFPSHDAAIQFGRRSVTVTPITDALVQAQSLGEVRPLAENWQWPVQGPLSDYYGTCDPHLRGPHCENPHTGIDIDLFPFTQNGIHAAINATKSGIVTASYCSSSDGFGCRLVIDHGEGMSSMYAHLSEFEVTAGDQVSQGELIGYSGVTGFTTGEHLHFEIQKNGVPQNPLSYLP